MTHVLITGITGFVGSHLAEFCLRQPDVRVFGFRRYHLSSLRNVHAFSDRVTWIDCDMMEAKSVDKAIAAVRPDIVFHMASQSFVGPSWDHPTLYMDANYKMTVHLLEACLSAGINPRIHIPGSGEEYGDVAESDLPIHERTPLKPVNPYAVTKIAQDLIGYVYFRSFGSNVIRTRAFNHEGPRRDKWFGIPWYAYQIARIEQGLQDTHVKVGHLDDLRNFTHVLDMVRAYWLAVEQCPPGELFLIGSERTEDIFTFRQALERLIGMSSVAGITYAIDPQYVRPTNVPRLICDAAKFRTLTGWTPEIGFDRILADTLEYWRAEVRANPAR
jgi:GDP-4-dehydro-6-deoxy-D-mannose reductase